MKTRTSTLLVSAASILLLAAGSANAQNLVVDGSFESGNYPGGSPNPNAYSLGVGSTAITGWTTVNAEISWNHSPVSTAHDTLTAQDGNYFLDLTGYHDGSPYGGVSQTISTVPGQSYSMSFFIGSDFYFNGDYPGYVLDPGVAVSINGSPIFSALVPVGSLNVPDLWTGESFTFTATSSSSTIALVGTSNASNNPYIGLDNVVVEAVPEPSTLGLVLTAIASVPLLAKRGK